MEDKNLQQLMAEVQKELNAALEIERVKLSKAHPGEETSSEVPADESATASPANEGGSEDSASAEGSAPPSGDEGSAPEASADAPAPPADDASAPPADGDPGMDQGLDPEQLKAEYAQLPVEELKMHYLAAKEALFAAMGAGGDPAGAGAPGMDASAPPAPDASAPPMAPPAGPPAGSAPPAPPADDQSAPPALKAEVKANPANGGKVTAVSKSEQDSEIEDLKKKLGDLEGVTADLLKVIEVAVVPARKAVTSVAQLEKSTGTPVSSLSKAEIDAKVKRAIRTDLHKSDRELINQFVVGMIGVEGIKHILDGVK